MLNVMSTLKVLQLLALSFLLFGSFLMANDVISENKSHELRKKHVQDGDFVGYNKSYESYNYRHQKMYFNGNLQMQEHKYFVKDFHFIVEAKMLDNVSEARVYFKEYRDTMYRLYVKMSCFNKKCHATLPVETSKLKQIDYTVIYKNMNGKLFKSREYSSIKRDLVQVPLWQKRYQRDPIKLYTEFQEAPGTVLGFQLTSEVTLTDSLDIFGVDAGLYALPDLYPIKDVDSLEERCKILNENNKL